MHRKIIFVLVALALISALGTQVVLSKEKQAPALDTSKIVRKLDEALSNQAEILKKFEEIKQELAIIKVRASR